MDAIWTRKNDRTHLHLRLIAWAFRRCDRRDQTVTTAFRKLAA